MQTRFWGGLLLVSGALSVTVIACSKAKSSESSPVASVEQTSIEEGGLAPDVQFPLQNGKMLSLSSLRGHPVVVYFYPKDDTPGCRVEAQGIRDTWESLQQAGITVVGVSEQDAESHKAFIQKENLPFDLAVDANGALAKAFGVPVRLGFAARQTFLIDKDGRVKKIWRDVTPEGHAGQILTAASS